MKKSRVIISFISLIAIASTQLACSNNPPAPMPPVQAPPAQTQPPAPIQPPQTGTMPLSPASMFIKFKDMDSSKLGIPAQRLVEINKILNGLGLKATFESDHFEGIKTMKILSQDGGNPSDETVQNAGKHLHARLSYVEFAEANRRNVRLVF